ncbi:MAG: hydantoinase/oxoprolinase family protein, partial [Candidatus Heimdallarchaeota archaeon]
SIKEKIASKLDLSVYEGALGIIEIANINMSRILRIVTVERGLDPRDFILIAFGGAGPLHACALASELEMSHIIIPNSPGLFSAMGLLFTDVKHTYVKSIREKIKDLDYQVIEIEFRNLEEKGSVVLDEEGFKEKDILHQRFAELRYIGQGFELLIPLSEIELVANTTSTKIKSLFNEKHKAIYGYTMENEEVEVVNIRVNSFGLIKKPVLKNIKSGAKKPIKEALVENRQVLFDKQKDFIKTPIFDRTKLLAKNEVTGPAIIEQYDTTTVIPLNWKAKVDEFGLIHLHRM